MEPNPVTSFHAVNGIHPSEVDPQWMVRHNQQPNNIPQWWNFDPLDPEIDYTKLPSQLQVRELIWNYSTKDNAHDFIPTRLRMCQRMLCITEKENGVSSQMPNDWIGRPEGWASFKFKSTNEFKLDQGVLWQIHTTRKAVKGSLGKIAKESIKEAKIVCSAEEVYNLLVEAHIDTKSPGNHHARDASFDNFNKATGTASKAFIMDFIRCCPTCQDRITKAEKARASRDSKKRAAPQDENEEPQEDMPRVCRQKIDNYSAPTASTVAIAAAHAPQYELQSLMDQTRYRHMFEDDLNHLTPPGFNLFPAELAEQEPAPDSVAHLAPEYFEPTVTTITIPAAHIPQYESQILTDQTYFPHMFEGKELHQFTPSNLNLSSEDLVYSARPAYPTPPESTGASASYLTLDYFGQTASTIAIPAVHVPRYEAQSWVNQTYPHDMFADEDLDQLTPSGLNIFPAEAAEHAELSEPAYAAPPEPAAASAPYSALENFNTSVFDNFDPTYEVPEGWVNDDAADFSVMDIYANTDMDILFNQYGG
jgi:hypothetical protein